MCYVALQLGNRLGQFMEQLAEDPPTPTRGTAPPCLSNPRAYGRYWQLYSLEFVPKSRLDYFMALLVCAGRNMHFLLHMRARARWYGLYYPSCIHLCGTACIVYPARLDLGIARHTTQQPMQTSPSLMMQHVVCGINTTGTSSSPCVFPYPPFLFPFFLQSAHPKLQNVPRSDGNFYYANDLLCARVDYLVRKLSFPEHYYHDYYDDIATAAEKNRRQSSQAGSNADESDAASAIMNSVTACHHLFVWSVLMMRYELAQIFWLHGGHTMQNSLLASQLLRHMAHAPRLRQHLRFRSSVCLDMLALADRFEEDALSVLDACHEVGSQPV